LGFSKLEGWNAEGGWRACLIELGLDFDKKSQNAELHEDLEVDK
jgi:hypothetical protein